jgi:hypothetical protein
MAEPFTPFIGQNNHLVLEIRLSTGKSLVKITTNYQELAIL